MRFVFETGKEVDTQRWEKTNKALMQDLTAYAAGLEVVSEDEIVDYVQDIFKALRKIDNEKASDMLFLMYDDPRSMPADCRVEYVYKPTYIAATMLMTFAVRYRKVWEIQEFESTLSELLNACTGRGFMGAGYDDITGLFDTLRIFAAGDTLQFVREYPDISSSFTAQMVKTITYLETQICTGKVKNGWTGKDYSDRGEEVLRLLNHDHNTESKYVWYACYGSNISRDRFMIYINGCSDTTPPVEDRPFEFFHNIYFAKRTGERWDYCGKAFLDVTTEGYALGRIYKITREQYSQIQRKEGRDYRQKVDLGIIDGIPVYSFTDTQKNDEIRLPSAKYYNTILKGLEECYASRIPEKELVFYLNKAVMPEKTFEVLWTIKENPKFMTNTEIQQATGLDQSDVVNAVTWLLEKEMIVQDSRSIRRGHSVSDPEAFFYTQEGPCGRELAATMISAEKRC